MSNRRLGLGRGLDALIPQPRTPSTVSSGSVQTIDIDRIVPNPRQPRQRFAPDTLHELAESIREHGVIQPLIVMQIRTGEVDATPRYQLIAGERRWQASKLAGLMVVPVVVREASTQQMLELALIENIQRSDLNPLEEALAYRQLMDDFQLTQEQAAARVGKSRVAVANAVRLLKLPEEIQRVLAEGQISEGHARAFLRLESESDQRKLLKHIIDDGWSVRQAETFGTPAKTSSTRSRTDDPEESARDPQGRHLEQQFRRALGTKVTLVRHRSGGGRLIVEFFSDEELQSIHDRIIGTDR
ncbi:MAG: ParB/RepB/Spo0J family partition protein [Chloroflexi bacterium]|nr:ParB/RepB/Spo0J family partition protein [Chloroflexota bacterium]